MDDYDGCEIPLERMDDFEPEETYIIPNPVLAEKGEEETGGNWLRKRRNPLFKRLALDAKPHRKHYVDGRKSYNLFQGYFPST